MSQQDQPNLENQWVANEKECYCQKKGDLPDCTLASTRPYLHRECGMGPTSIDQGAGKQDCLKVAELLMDTNEVSSITLECSPTYKVWNLRFTTYSKCANNLADSVLSVESKAVESKL